MKKDNSLTRNSAILGLGAFLAKLIGALYRVPLTNLLGGYGLGLYQMVFPLYCVLLDFSGAGVPSAISKLIGSCDVCEREQKGRYYLKTAIRLFSFFGIVAGLIMCIASNFLSKSQGDAGAVYAYIFLSPAVVLVCIVSCFRGYFQGQLNMYPTALSQILEQVIKLLFGIIFCKLMLPNIPLAVGGATLAITFSEFFAFLFLLFVYKYKVKKLPKLNKQKKYIYNAKKLLKLTIPITLVVVILPLSQVIDSFLIINKLKIYMDNATAVYGLFSGVVLTVIHLPVSICYGISQSIIPTMAGAKNAIEQKINVKKSLGLTLILSILASICCISFSQLIIKILFKNLAVNENVICIKLLKITSPAIVFHCLLNTVNGVLIGKGKTYSILIGMLVGVVIKVVLNIILLPIPEINIYACGISLIACYFFALLINLIIVIKVGKNHASKKINHRQQVC